MQFDYKLQDQKLHKVQGEKDFGVFIHEQLTIENQMSDGLNKATGMYGLLRRIFSALARKWSCLYIKHWQEHMWLMYVLCG